MNVRGLIPVVVAVCAIALTPVFAYADAVPKNEKTLSDAAAEKVVVEALAFAKGSSNGNMVSMAAKDWDTFRARLAGLKLDGVNKGQIMRVIAQANKDENSSDEDAKADDEEKTAPGREANKGKHKGAAVDEDKIEAAPAVVAPPSPSPTPTTDRGKSEAIRQRAQTEAPSKATGDLGWNSIP